MQSPHVAGVDRVSTVSANARTDFPHACGGVKQSSLKGEATETIRLRGFTIHLFLYFSLTVDTLL